MDQSILESICTRCNQNLAARQSQIELNQLAAAGGKEYTRRVLTQFPNESLLDFQGGSRYDGARVQGRVGYTPDINYTPQIIADVNNFTFFNDITRLPEPDKDIISNIDGGDNHIDHILKQANTYLTTSGWCWIAVDAPHITNEEISILEKAEMGIRPYIYTINPLDVIDWSIDRSGINWVIQKSIEMLNDDNPYAANIPVEVYRLWERGKVTIIKVIPSTDKRRKPRYEATEINLNIPYVPFVLVGNPSDGSILFDTLNSISKNILDLESSNKQVFLDVAFPQQFITTGTFERIYQQTLSSMSLAGNGVVNEQAAYQAAISMATGTKAPIIIPDGQNPFVPAMPTGLVQIRDEITANVESLMNISGISLKKTSNLQESALSKAFDLLKIQGLVKDRCRILESVENTAVMIAGEMDSSFQPWTAEYNPALSVAETFESVEEPTTE